jgi:hypothetical protein
MRRSVAGLCFLALVIVSQATPFSLGVRPKAVVLILADDLGYNMVGYHNKTVLSPNIDALAAGGIKLENFYVAPVCSPTRSSLMTGRYTYRLGTQATVIRADVGFGVPLRETFFPQNMQDAGLTTALFGKWVSYSRPDLRVTDTCCSSISAFIKVPTCHSSEDLTSTSAIIKVLCITTHMKEVVMGGARLAWTGIGVTGPTASLITARTRRL